MITSCFTEWEEHVLDEREHTVVLDIARLTESLLQLFLNLSRAVQKIDLGILL